MEEVFIGSMEDMSVGMEDMGVGMKVEVYTGMKVSDVGGLKTKGRTFKNELYNKEIRVHLLVVISGVTRGNKAFLEHRVRLSERQYVRLALFRIDMRVS